MESSHFEFWSAKPPLPSPHFRKSGYAPGNDPCHIQDNLQVYENMKLHLMIFTTDLTENVNAL